MNDTYMKRAIELSREHMENGDGGPFGAIVVMEGRIVGEGWNCVTSTQDPTAHAEVMAIRHACRTLGNFELRGAYLFTSCEPCPMCLSAAYWARVDRIFFAATREDAARHQFDDDFIYREIPLPREKRQIPMAQIGRDDAYEVFKAWDRKSDKIRY